MRSGRPARRGSRRGARRCGPRVPVMKSPDHASIRPPSMRARPAPSRSPAWEPPASGGTFPWTLRTLGRTGRRHRPWSVGFDLPIRRPTSVRRGRSTLLRSCTPTSSGRSPTICSIAWYAIACPSGADEQLEPIHRPNLPQRTLAPSVADAEGGDAEQVAGAEQLWTNPSSRLTRARRGYSGPHEQSTGARRSG